MKVKLHGPVRLFVTPWTVAYEAPPSRGFSMQEYWSGLPFPSPGYLPNPGIEPGSLALQTDALPSEPPGNPIKYYIFCFIAKHFVFYFTYVSQYTEVRCSASFSFSENWAGGRSTILKFSGSLLEQVSPKKVFFSAITYHLLS